MNTNPVGWFEIYVEDLERARAFYEKVLELKLNKLDIPGGEVQMWTFPMFENAPGCTGALVKMNGMQTGGLGTMVYFNCEDCANEEARVESAGGQVHRPKMPIGEYGFISLIKDTEGNLIGLHSRQ